MPGQWRGGEAPQDTELIMAPLNGENAKAARMSNEYLERVFGGL